MAIPREFLSVMLSVALASPLMAQQPAGQQPQQTLPNPQLQGAAMEKLRLNYVLGANDVLVIRVPQAEEIHEKTFRVDVDGSIFLTQVGNIKAAGLTVEQLETEVTRLLRKYYQAPVVTITVVQYRSDPVFLIGAFRSPGIYPLTGTRTLVELLSSTGGLQPNSSHRIRITRKLEQGRIPLPNATENREAGISVAEVNVNRLMETVNPVEDIILKPYDVLRVGVEEMVYISGEVGKSGAFSLNDKDSISVLQLLAMTGGVGPSAAPEKAKILRPILDTSRRAEIPVNLKDVMSGRANDIPLMPNDVLVIPRSSGKKQVIERAALIVVPALVTTLIYVAIR